MRKFILALTILLSSCFLKQSPLTPELADHGTYKIFSDKAQGTAWAIDSYHLVTAGHVCETFEENFVLVGDGERRFHAKSILWEKTSDSGLTDLCVLETNVTLSSPLILADRMPFVGESIGYVGYPLGKWTSESGTYLGDLDGPEDWNNAVFDAPCDHGASGSAVFFSRGVWGVLVRLRTDGGHIHDGSDGCVAIPLGPIKKLLAHMENMD